MGKCRFDSFPVHKARCAVRTGRCRAGSDKRERISLTKTQVLIDKDGIAGSNPGLSPQWQSYIFFFDGAVGCRLVFFSFKIYEDGNYNNGCVVQREL